MYEDMCMRTENNCLQQVLLFLEVFNFTPLILFYLFCCFLLLHKSGHSASTQHNDLTSSSQILMTDIFQIDSIYIIEIEKYAILFKYLNSLGELSPVKLEK